MDLDLFFGLCKVIHTQVELISFFWFNLIVGGSGSRDVSGSCFDFGRHVPPDVSTFVLNLKAKHIFPRQLQNLHVFVKMPIVRRQCVMDAMNLHSAQLSEKF